MIRTSTGWFLGLALLVSACNGEPDDTAVLGAIDCDAAAFPGSFLRQAAGLFTPGELGARAPGSAQVDGLPAKSGLLMGHFSFWTELVDAVPFEQPGNVVCQVLLFDEADYAAAFVESLQPTSESISHAAIGWPLNGDLEVQEVTAAAGGSAHRVFVATREENRRPLEIVLLFEAVEHLVVSVHAGGIDKQKQPTEWERALESIRQVAEQALAD